MKAKAAIKRIIETLKGIYPDALCSLNYEKDYELLFAVRLAAQCTDARVNQVTPALYARFPTLQSFAEADAAEVGQYVRSCGFFNSKARDIVACAQKLILEHGGKVPGTMEELTALPGVGRKTANLILGDVYGPLYSHHRPSRHHGRQQGPPSGGTAAPSCSPGAGVLQLLSSHGAFRTGHLHRPVSQVRGLPAGTGLRFHKGGETGSNVIPPAFPRPALRPSYPMFAI